MHSASWMWGFFSRKKRLGACYCFIYSWLLLLNFVVDRQDPNPKPTGSAPNLLFLSRSLVLINIIELSQIEFKPHGILQSHQTYWWMSLWTNWIRSSSSCWNQRHLMQVYIFFPPFANPICRCNWVLVFCSCSVCHMKQNIHFIVPNHHFKLTKGSDKLTTYTFNTHQAKHTFCSICGVQSFYTPRSNPDGKGSYHKYWSTMLMLWFRKFKI